MCLGGQGRVCHDDSDVCWGDRAVADMAVVIHVASPFPLSNPKREDDLIRPAVDGTLSVLRACAKAGTVSRVVLTSSCAAVDCECMYRRLSFVMCVGFLGGVRVFFPCFCVFFLVFVCFFAFWCVFSRVFFGFYQWWGRGG